VFRGTPEKGGSNPAGPQVGILEIVSWQGVIGGDVGFGMAGIPILLAWDWGKIKKFNERGMMVMRIRLFFILFLFLVVFFIYVIGGISAIQGAKGSKVLVEGYMERVEKLIK